MLCYETTCFVTFPKFLVSFDNLRVLFSLFYLLLIFYFVCFVELIFISFCIACFVLSNLFCFFWLFCFVLFGLLCLFVLLIFSSFKCQENVSNEQIYHEESENHGHKTQETLLKAIGQNNLPNSKYFKIFYPKINDVRILSISLNVNFIMRNSKINVPRS